MKKNLQLVVLALALCCVTLNAQNKKTTSSNSTLFMTTNASIEVSIILQVNFNVKNQGTLLSNRMDYFRIPIHV